MSKTARRSVTARLAAPAALVGVVAVFSFVAFSSGSAQADTTTSTTAPAPYSRAAMMGRAPVKVPGLVAVAA